MIAGWTWDEGLVAGFADGPLVLFIIVVVLVAAFWLGLFVAVLCQAAKRGDRMLDFTADAARGDLERLRDGRHPW